jgi:hypothetical protein
MGPPLYPACSGGSADRCLGRRDVVIGRPAQTDPAGAENVLRSCSAGLSSTGLKLSYGGCLLGSGIDPVSDVKQLRRSDWLGGLIHGQTGCVKPSDDIFGTHTVD